MEMPAVPRGSGEHPFCLTVITSGDLAKSQQFYSGVFGWQMMPLTAEICACSTPAGQACALRTGLPEGFQAVVPFIRVDDVDASVTVLVDHGFNVEKAKWSAPGVGDMARLTTRSGLVVGFIKPANVDYIPTEPLPSGLGNGPKPPLSCICSVELYSGNFGAAAQNVQSNFGWGTLETMPNYMAFDTGAGYSGIFQSHTPAIPALAYIYCDDVAAKIATIEAAGGKRMCEPMAMPGLGTFGYFNDPTGTAMGLIGP